MKRKRYYAGMPIMRELLQSHMEISFYEKEGNRARTYQAIYLLAVHDFLVFGNPRLQSWEENTIGQSCQKLSLISELTPLVPNANLRSLFGVLSLVILV
jgi:hypothetical protein